MGKARRTPICMLGGIILVALGVSVPSISLGELSSPVPGGETAMKIDDFPKETKTDVMPFVFGTKGLHAEEFEGKHTADHLLPLQRVLSIEDQELVETTDASGGTMIHLQGRFQSRLQVSHENMDSLVEKFVSPVFPD